jgi:3-oxoacyl-(acyl-carrier-protein) synthase
VRPVHVAGWSILEPGPSGRVEGFDPVAAGVPRKHLKTMTRAVQLGVAAVSAAIARTGSIEGIPPERRGLYVGASPQAGEAGDLAAALAESGPGGEKFATRGIPLVPPLWLVKGLSNNVLGYASAQHDLRGDNGNWCDGRLGGAIAIATAVRAVAEGRADLAIAGGADCLVGADDLLGIRGTEGAAFLVLVRGRGEILARAGLPADLPESEAAELGAAAIPLRLCAALDAGAIPAEIGGIVLARG